MELVEPLAEYYLRRSQSYQFVLSVLRDTFSAEELAGMQRLRETGPVGRPLVEEVEEMVVLFQGLHDIALHELGFTRSEAGIASDAAEEQARRWVADIREDPDMQADNRMMVPLSREGGVFKVWCIAGFCTRALEVEMMYGPRFIHPAKSEPRDVRVKRGICSYYDQHYVVFFEAHTRRLLDRPEFRELCDRHRTVDAIKTAVEALV
eukprot:m51a1_g11667 hypothetical protein (207) ;mRNA; f:120-927